MKCKLLDVCKEALSLKNAVNNPLTVRVNVNRFIMQIGETVQAFRHRKITSITGQYKFVKLEPRWTKMPWYKPSRWFFLLCDLSYSVITVYPGLDHSFKDHVGGEYYTCGLFDGMAWRRMSTIKQTSLLPGVPRTLDTSLLNK